MKIKIEVDTVLNEKEAIALTIAALRKRETLELLQSFEPGEDFLMEQPTISVRITKL